MKRIPGQWRCGWKVLGPAKLSPFSPLKMCYQDDQTKRCFAEGPLTVFKKREDAEIFVYGSEVFFQHQTPLKIYPCVYKVSSDTQAWITRRWPYDHKCFLDNAPKGTDYADIVILNDAKLDPPFTFPTP